jgi:hypothetical protein
MNRELSKEEWDEMSALKLAINDYPASVIPEKQERFTELYVRSIQSLLNKST